MVFADLTFLYLFLPCNLLVYYICGNRNYRNMVLVVFSLFFYAWGEPIWVTLLLFSALADYLHGLLIARCPGKALAKLAVVSSLVVNLGLLATFKYSAWVVQTVNALLGTAFGAPAFGLPIGISFYTFQTLSYTIDVYRGQVKAQRSFGRFLLFVSLYHQLVAGPIVRYGEIAARIARRTESWAEMSHGVNRFMLGLGKKVLLANTAGKLAATYLEGDGLTVVGAWLGAVLFALQIYYDFSGYSDMAIGLGHMFGFRHPENFRYPYTAVSATDFWRRWHITLGGFFRDYLYIPLGGNRSHMARNLLLTWLATGLWHGASWNFVLWGLYYGGLIWLERGFLLRRLERLPRAVSHLYLLVAMLFGWVLFYFTDLSRGAAYMGRMLGIGAAGLCDWPTVFDLCASLFWLLPALLLCLPLYPLLLRILRRLPNRWQLCLGWCRPVWNMALLLACTASLVGQSYNPFLYFRF